MMMQMPTIDQVRYARSRHFASTVPVGSVVSGSELMASSYCENDLAEEEGFEPSYPGLPGKRFSRPPHSTTLPPLRRGPMWGAGVIIAQDACSWPKIARLAQVAPKSILLPNGNDEKRPSRRLRKEMQ